MSFVNVYQNSTNRVLSKFILHIFFVIICSIYLSFAGCGGNNEEKPKTTSEEASVQVEPAVEKVSVDEISKELQANKDKWTSHDITNYEIEMQKICFCPPDAVRLMIFEVENSEINSVRYADTDETVEPGLYSNYNTLNGLFDLAEQAIEKNPNELTISYDKDYGFIKEISIDYEYQIADDEITILTSSMRPEN